MVLTKLPKRQMSVEVYVQKTARPDIMPLAPKSEVNVSLVV